MPFALNPVDDVRTYFEDDGGTGPPVGFHGGFGEPIELVRGSALARAVPDDEFRHIYVDHRGHGRSDKPHNPEDYSIALRTGDAVLDEPETERAHFVGMSWGVGSASVSVSMHRNVSCRW